MKEEATEKRFNIGTKRPEAMQNKNHISSDQVTRSWVGVLPSLQGLVGPSSPVENMNQDRRLPQLHKER